MPTTSGRPAAYRLIASTLARCSGRAPNDAGIAMSMARSMEAGPLDAPTAGARPRSGSRPGLVPAGAGFGYGRCRRCRRRRTRRPRWDGHPQRGPQPGEPGGDHELRSALLGPVAGERRLVSGIELSERVAGEGGATLPVASGEHGTVGAPRCGEAPEGHPRGDPQGSDREGPDLRLRRDLRPPPAWSDGHHIHHWADGGPTDLSNLVLLCRRHHQLIHHHGFRVEMADNSPVFFRPDGTVIEGGGRAPP